MAAAALSSRRSNPGWIALVLAAVMVWPHFARATTPSRVVVDVMPACATGWRRAGPTSQPSVGLRHDVAVTTDAVLVVRSADGRRIAVLRKGERRAWVCMPPPEPAPNT